MLFAHESIGYLQSKIFKKSSEENQSLYFKLALIIGNRIPDIDYIFPILINIFKLPISENHRSYITHTPVFYLAIFGVLFLVLGKFKQSLGSKFRFYKKLFIITFFGVFSHLVFDSIFGIGIRWIWPIGDNYFSIQEGITISYQLSSVSTFGGFVQRSLTLNKFPFFVESLIVTSAVIWFIKSRDMKLFLKLKFKIGQTLVFSYSALLVLIFGLNFKNLLSENNSEIVHAQGDKFSIAFLYTNDSVSDVEQSLNRAHTKLTAVSPTYFVLQKDGSIVSFEEDKWVNLLKKYPNLEIHPRFKNGEGYDAYSEFFSGESVDNGIENILKSVENYDGINLDIEGINSTDREPYTDFVCRLYKRAKEEGKILTVDVPAKIYDATTGWGGPFDYKKIMNCSDKMIIMGYDYITSRNPNPQSLAPINWVAKTVDYAKTQTDNDEKIVLALPFYGLDWNLSTNKAEYVKFNIVQNRRVADPNSSEWWNPTTATQVLNYTDGNGDKHEVWYENSGSVFAKLRIANEKKIGGTAFWRLTQEDAGVWNEFFDFEYVSQSETFAYVEPREKKSVFIKIKNTSEVEWKVGEVFLGTTNLQDRDSSFFDEKTWSSPNRIGLQKNVKPGEIAIFEFDLEVPENFKGEIKEYFRPVAEFKTWMKDIGIHFIIVSNIPNQEPDIPPIENPTEEPENPDPIPDYFEILPTYPNIAAGQKIKIYKNSTREVEIKLRNISSEIWRNPDFVIEANPNSAFKSVTWNSENKFYLSESPVKIGEVGSFIINLKAQNSSGLYKECLSVKNSGELIDEICLNIEVV